MDADSNESKLLVTKNVLKSYFLVLQNDIKLLTNGGGGRFPECYVKSVSIYYGCRLRSG